MTFGKALELLKQGERVCRKGWNGKNMWLWLVSSWTGDILGASPDPLVYLDAMQFIAMKTADDKTVPWLASQTDMLAEDWQTAE